MTLTELRTAPTDTPPDEYVISGAVVMQDGTKKFFSVIEPTLGVLRDPAWWQNLELTLRMSARPLPTIQ